MIKKLVPDEDLRNFILSRLLKSVHMADSIAPTAWTLTMFPYGFRLNVGGTEVLYLLDELLRVNVIAPAGSPVRSIEDVEACTYRSIKAESFAYLGPLSAFVHIEPALDAGHAEFVRLAATRKDGSPKQGSRFRSSHDDGLILYALRELGSQSNLLGDSFTLADDFALQALDVDVASAGLPGAWEGIERVSIGLVKSRSSRLREEVMARANGTCEGCQINFVALFGLGGDRVLQVHHINPLKDACGPVYTTVDDLVVLCANCHCLTHQDGAVALRLAEVRELWRRARNL